MKLFCQAHTRIFLCISWWKMGYKNSYCDLDQRNTIKGYVLFLPQKANQDFRQINFKHIFAVKKSNITGLQLVDLVVRPLVLRYLRPRQENRAFSPLKEKIIFSCLSCGSWLMKKEAGMSRLKQKRATPFPGLLADRVNPILHKLYSTRSVLSSFQDLFRVVRG